MADKKKKKDKEPSPEEIQRRKFRYKCRFRAIGRMVMANIYWLAEAAEHYEGVDDVKRRVAQAVRGKVKKKALLSITDKALLNKPARDRTDDEKKYIYRIIGGLKCFKKYPKHVKRKLAAVTYFQYYGPNRVIVREDQDAHALYFVVTGEIIVSHMIYDELLQQFVSVDIGNIHAGNMFGEVSLLHNIPRTATCTTAGHCELLMLMKEDFKNILQASVQKQWDEVRQAMAAFSYFDALDEVACREGCIVAKMKSYAVNETILGDGVGVANFVYFILSGRCQMIESLMVSSKTHLGRISYFLYDPYVPEEQSEQDFDTKYFAGRKFGSSSQDKSKELSGSAPIVKPESLDMTTRNQSSTIKLMESSKQSQSLRSSKKSSDARGSIEHEESVTAVTGARRGSSQTEDKATGPRTDSIVTREMAMPSIEERTSVRFSIEEKAKVPPNLHTYFMQVCQFNPGSTFGFGENMRDRRIVALTPVDAMLLPKMWLMQRNTANIWTRIQYYLEKKIPSKKQLFKEFVSERRWQEFRNQMVDDVIANCNMVNWTSVHDVPYSIRMEEMLDI